MKKNNRNSSKVDKEVSAIIRKYSYYTIYEDEVYWLYDSSYSTEETWLLNKDKEYFDIPHYQDVPGTRLLLIDRGNDLLLVGWDEEERKWKVSSEFSY